MTHHLLKPVVLALISGMALNAADLTFTGSVSSDWSTAGNWSPSTVTPPTVGDNVTIPTGLSVQVSDAAVCNNLTLVGTLRLVTDGSLELSSGAAASIQGSLLVEGTNTSLRQSTEADADTPALTVTVGASGTLTLGSNSGAVGQLTFQRGINLVNNGNLVLNSNGNLQFQANAYNRLETTNRITWVMTTANPIILDGGGTVSLGGTLSATRDSSYLPSAGDEAVLVQGISSLLGDFTSNGAITGFTRISSTAKVAYTSDTNTALANVVTILTPTPTSPRYGDSISLTYSATNTGGTVLWSGLPADKVSVSGTTARLIGIGTGATIQATMASQGGYAADSDNIALPEILPKQVTVTVVGGTRSVGGTNPAPTFTTNGLVNGDLASSLGTAEYSGTGTTADSTTTAGSYPITVNFTGSNRNYNIIVVDGSLVITTPSSTSTTDAGAGGGGGGCGVGGGMALLAVGMALARRRR